MDANSFREAILQAIHARNWVTIHSAGCAVFMIRPTSVEIQMDVAVIEGLLPRQRDDSVPPSTKDLQSGEAMKARLKEPPERSVSIHIDPVEIKAVVIHHS